jgi:hypothetical protein
MPACPWLVPTTDFCGNGGAGDHLPIEITMITPVMPVSGGHFDG